MNFTRTIGYESRFTTWTPGTTAKDGDGAVDPHLKHSGWEHSGSGIGRLDCWAI